MLIEETYIEGLYVLTPKKFGDDRGWFMESFNLEILSKHGLNINFVQDNHSYTAHKNTIRGIHFQKSPMAQTKLVRCSRGTIYDVAVDLRKNSPTYLKYFGIELSAENGKQLLIPNGFGHAFLSVTEDVEVQYKVDQFYSKEHDRSIIWNDPSINIDWNVINPILSDKDKNAPQISEVDCDF